MLRAATASDAALWYPSARLAMSETDRWDHESVLGQHSWPSLLERKMGRSQGGGSWSRTSQGPPAFPIRKHILLVSGCCSQQLFVAVGYALQLTKNSLKNNHFLSAQRQGENARAHTYTHRHTHTYFPAAGSLLSRTSCFVSEAPGRGSGSTEAAEPAPFAALLRAWLPHSLCSELSWF